MPNEKDKDVFMTTQVTNIEIYELLKKTHKQTKETNGRVTKLEDKSLGLWISNHPFKFLIASMIFISVVISDIRHPIITFLTKFI